MATDNVEGLIKSIRDGINKPEFKIENVSFRVDKLSAIAGHDLFEKIRYELSKTMNGIPAEKSDDGSAYLLAILQLSPSFIKEIREEFFLINKVQRKWC